jgi:hypothetical protein
MSSITSSAGICSKVCPGWITMSPSDTLHTLTDALTFGKELLCLLPELCLSFCLFHISFERSVPFTTPVFNFL